MIESAEDFDSKFQTQRGVGNNKYQPHWIFVFFWRRKWQNLVGLEKA
jgi:hypothetical protein